MAHSVPRHHGPRREAGACEFSSVQRDYPAARKLGHTLVTAGDL